MRSIVKVLGFREVSFKGTHLIAMHREVSLTQQGPAWP